MCLYACYRPQTRFREGNVFTGVYLSTGAEYLISNASWNRSHGRVPTSLPWTSDMGIYPLLATSGGDHWIPVQTCLFGDLTPPPPQQHLVVATETEACAVSKRAVCILVECCLVDTCVFGQISSDFKIPKSKCASGHSWQL